MANINMLKRILAISPYVEVLVRRVYWKNVTFLSKFIKRKNSKALSKSDKVVKFDRVIAKIKEMGINDGNLLLVHSSYDVLKCSGLTAEQIVDLLLRLVGPSGTLAMPAMPVFRNDVSREDYLNTDISDRVYVYDRKKSRIITGALPTALSRIPGAIRSIHPINTMVAAGRLAADIMKDNLEGESPLPCGVQSSWFKCYQSNAWILGLGVDLTHSLTMIHVAEDIQDGKWPIPNWYREKQFEILDGDIKIKKTLRERKPKWGTMCFAERTLCKDLLKSKIMRSTTEEGITLELLRAKDLIDFLMQRNAKGYPYFGLNV